jgi:hypothetical protein
MKEQPSPPVSRPSPGVEAESKMQKYIFERGSLPPIAFIGELIGRGSNRGPGSKRCTKVNLYRTVSGKMLAHVQRTVQAGPDGAAKEGKGPASDDGSPTMEWLRGEKDWLGSVSKKALEKALKSHTGPDDFWVEELR